jgi:diguanylate cyclase (GGDEF)-like protein
LTGLANRRFFNAALEAEIRRAVRERTALTLLLCDIDRFKRHNDTFGHRGGDALLRLLGSVIQRYCRRAGDCAARYGGEEFALILPQLKRDDAWALAEDLRQTVSELTIRHSGTNRLQRVTMSIGATTFESDEVCASGTLIDIADAALYQAKNCGRNRTEFHSFEVKAGDARGRKSGR